MAPLLAQPQDMLTTPDASQSARVVVQLSGPDGTSIKIEAMSATATDLAALLAPMLAARTAIPAEQTTCHVSQTDAEPASAPYGMLSREGAAKFLAISPRTLDRLIADDRSKIPCIKIYGCRVFDPDTLKEWALGMIKRGGLK